MVYSSYFESKSLLIVVYFEIIKSPCYDVLGMEFRTSRIVFHATAVSRVTLSRLTNPQPLAQIISNSPFNFCSSLTYC